MPKIGQKPLEIPQGVDIKLDPPKILVKGPLGELSCIFPEFIKIKKQGAHLKIEINNPKNKNQRAMRGTANRLIENMIKGVTAGYEKKLQLVGIGFNAKIEGDNLVLNIGFSHPIKFLIPEGVKIQVEKNTQVSIKGIDKQLVGETADRIRRLKKPEPYKAKGIRYETEVVRKKVVKKAIVTTE